MPIYEFKCDKCKETAEKLIKYPDPEFRPLCQCGGYMKKVISAGSFQFNASGFYATDYKGK